MLETADIVRANKKQLQKALIGARLGLLAIGEPGGLGAPDNIVCGVIARSALLRVKLALGG